MVRKSHQTVKLELVSGGGGGDMPNHKVAQIKSAAIRLFLKDGFDGVTMDMVAKKSGVSKSTLYAHFADKRDLFAAVMIGEAQRANAEIWPPACDAEDIDEILRTVARNYYRIFMTERAFAFKRTILGALPRFPEIGKIIFEGGPMQIAEKIAALLTAAQDRDLLQVDDPSIAAIQFMGLIRGDVEIMGMFSVKGLTRTEIDDRIDNAIKMFLARYGKKEAVCNKNIGN